MHRYLVLVASAAIAIAAAACASPPPPATPPPEPADARAWPELVWANADVPAIQAPVTEHLAAVAASDRGFVAIGFREVVGRRDGVIVFSPDGRTWERVGAEAAMHEVDLVDVAAGPDGFVAVGTASAEGQPPATVMFRAADGRSWERIVPPGAIGTYVYSLGGGTPGYLAAGNTEGGGPASWISADGASWERVPTDALGAGTGGIVDPRSEGEGWIALGSIGDAPAFLRSADGIRWTATPIGPTDDTYTDRLVAGRWGYIVQGGHGSCGLFSSCPAETVTWWSGDGASWTRLPAEDALRGGGVALAEAGDRGVIGVNGLSAWSSTTGWTWTPLAGPDAAGDAGFNAVVVRGDGIVAVGEQYIQDGRSVARIVYAE